MADKDPSKRIERFRRQQRANASQGSAGSQRGGSIPPAPPAWLTPSHQAQQDDDNMSVRSFATEELPNTPDTTQSFHSSAPNRKLLRSRDQPDHSSRRGRAIATQHVVLSNNFLGAR